MALYGGIAKIEPSRGISDYFYNIYEIQEGEDGSMVHFTKEVLRKC
jgi:hypothetical protein